MFGQLESLYYIARAFVEGQPVLFVLVSGLIPAVISVLGEILMYWAARLGGRPLAWRVASRFRMNTRHIDWTENVF